MGMFDLIQCDGAVLEPLGCGDAGDYTYQTKDTPAQFLDTYKIVVDPTDGRARLYHEVYDIEDQSDPDAKGVQRLIGMMTRVNPRWEWVDNFSGTIEFYYSNICASGPHPTLGYASITTNDEPYVGYNFTATVIDGEVVRLVGGKEAATQHIVSHEELYKEDRHD